MNSMENNASAMSQVSRMCYDIGTEEGDLTTNRAVYFNTLIRDNCVYNVMPNLPNLAFQGNFPSVCLHLKCTYCLSGYFSYFFIKSLVKICNCSMF